MTHQHPLFLGFFLLAAAVPAHAVTYYWDSDGTTPGFGDTNGTWGSSAFWSTGTGDSAGTATPTNAITLAADTVNFGTATLAYGTSAKTITLSGNQSAGTMVWGAAQTPAVKFATIAGTNFITLASGGSLTVNAGNHQIEGTGNGSSGSSRDFSFSGTGGSFSIAADSSFEIKGRIGGGTNNTSAGYSKTGNGTLIFSGNNGGGSGWQFGSATTGFTVSGGVLRFAADAAFGNSGNKFVVASGAALELTGGFIQTVNAGTITLNGTGTGIGANGALRSVSGNNIISGTQAAGVGGIVLATNSSIGVDAGILTINQVVSNAAARNLTKVGAGTLVLGAANTYSGATTVSAGTLDLANTLAVQNTTGITLPATGTTLQFSTDTAFTTLPVMTVSSNVIANVVSNRATSGAGIVHALGAGSFGATNTLNFTAGANVNNVGTAGISYTSVNLAGGANGTTLLNPTTANLTIGTVNASNAAAKGLNLGGTSTGNAITGAVSNGSGGQIVSVTKSNISSWTLHGTNTYSGPTSISGGTLALGATGSIANSSGVNLAASTARFNTANANFTLGAAQTLSGIGTVENTGRIFTADGILAPGSSPGILTVDGGTVALGAGGDYNFQMLDAAGAAGTGYDTSSLINGASLDLSSLTAASYAINVFTLLSTGPDVAGDAANFNNTLNYSWTLVSTGNTITGFEASDFAFNTAGFTNALGGGSFSVGLADSSTDLTLNFTAVPEPRAALLGMLGLLSLLRRRR